MIARFRMQSTVRLFVSLGLAIVLSGSWPLTLCLAQTNAGTLVGKVRKRAGGVVDDAQIKLVNEQSGNERSVRTNAEGYFTIPNLRSGLYRITASKDGFFAQTYEHFPV